MKIFLLAIILLLVSGCGGGWEKIDVDDCTEKGGIILMNRQVSRLSSRPIFTCIIKK